MEKKEDKKLIINRKTLWTIPNILTYIRFLSVPIYMTLVILGARPAYPDWYVYIGLAVMVFAACTDVVDGKIARKYPGQGTYLGQVIDPFADKAMHLGALVCLSVAGYLHWAFIVLLLARELVMVVSSAFLMNKINIQANMAGKIASATLSVGIILCFFHPFMVPKAFGIDWMVVTVGLVFNWLSAGNYLIYAIKEMNKLKKADANAEIHTDTEEKK